MIYVVVNSSKIELPTAKMCFGDKRGNRSVAGQSSAIQMLEGIHQRRQDVVGSTNSHFCDFWKAYGTLGA